MKKWLLFLFLAFSIFAEAQTLPEISRILNSNGVNLSPTNITALNGDAFSIDLSTVGYRGIGFTLSGTWSAILQLQGSHDNSIWNTIMIYQPGGGVTQTQATLNGSYNGALTGFAFARLRATGFTSGTVVVKAFGFLGPFDMNAINLSGSVSLNGTSSMNLAQIAGNTILTGNGPTGTGSQRVTISDNNSPLAVTGAFFQTTQPVSIAATVPVTQSGTWTVQPGNTPNTVAWKVDGSAVTQPVSGPLTDVQLRASAVPVSLSSTTANIGTTNGLALNTTLTDRSQFTKITDGTNDASVKAASTAAIATDKALVVALSPNNTVPISAASLPLPTGATTETTLSALNAKFGSLGQKTMAGSTPVVFPSDQSAIPVTQSGTWNVGLNAGTNGIGKLTANSGVIIGDVNVVAAPTITKGTQGNGFSVQELKDAGRTTIALTAEVAGAATTEALATITESRNSATTTTFTSKVITSGKKLRIQSISIAIETLGSGTAPQRIYLRLRSNTAGATTASSPLQGTWMAVNNTAVVKSGSIAFYGIPDGIEFNGDGTATYGITLQFPDWVATTGTVQAKITIIAFEY